MEGKVTSLGESTDPSPNTTRESPRDLLAVDLDGTLVATDTLWESIARVVRANPAGAWRLPLWLLSGRAHFKAQLAAAGPVDASTLPYRPEVLERIAQRRAQGAETVLATASSETTARAVAEYLGVFDHVLASDASNNLAGPAKRAALENLAAGRPFDYLGNAGVDRLIWAKARRAIFVDPTRVVRRAIARKELEGELLVAPHARGPAALKAIRPRQWSKNALLFVPILLAHDLTNQASVAAAAVALVCFCAVASATYLLNDLLDIEADRRHPEKRNRPFATGQLPIPTGFLLCGALLVAGFTLSAVALSSASTAMLALYLVCTSAYSLWLKQWLFVDVLLLAGLYTLRVIAGGVAANVPVSTWLLAFSVFFFLSLALIKRYVELLDAQDAAVGTLPRRAYQASDIGLVETMGVSSGFLSVLVLGLYVSSADVMQLYSAPQWLWLITPVMLFWISRIWFLARRGGLASDPVLFATTDGPSYLCGACVVAIGTLASLAGP